MSFSAAAMEDATSEKPEDDESEDAIWQQAADELMLENQDQTSDSDLVRRDWLNRFKARLNLTADWSVVAGQSAADRGFEA